jgi:hypothetical protein
VGVHVVDEGRGPSMTPAVCCHSRDAWHVSRWWRGLW